MANYSETDARDARRIVESLLAPDRQIPGVGDALAVADIESDATEFAAELEMLEEAGADAPAVLVRGEELVPVAMSLVVGSWPFPWPIRPFRGRPWRRSFLYHEFVRPYLEYFMKEELRLYGFVTMPREQARDTFLRRATDFLATRIAMVRDLTRKESVARSDVPFLSVLQRAGGPRVSTPGCNFTVSTNSTGLRVFWSGAYRVSPNYFNHPTTPTVSVLQSGTYVFGVDGGAYGNQIQWDLNAVVTLPGNPNVHLNY